MTVPNQGGNYASIDVDAFGDAVSDLENIHEGIDTKITPLEDDFAFFGVDTSNLNKLNEAKNDLDGVLPGLRRRHSLALQLLAERQEQGLATDGTVSFQGDLLNDDFESVEDAQQAGRDTASLIEDGQIPEEVYEQLEQYGHDPDFAEAFMNELSPAERGLLMIDADNRTTSPYDDQSTGPQLAVAEVFATASFRINYDEDFVSEINQALMDHDPPLPADGIRIGERFVSLAQHGNWDHESLGALVETVTNGDYESVGNFNDHTGILTALSRNPRAAAEYMAADPGRTWRVSQQTPPGTSTEEWDAAFAEYLSAATVDADTIYARIGLYDEGQPNVAEENATYWINKYAEESNGDGPARFGDSSRGAFADIVEHYWDDLVYANSSPAGVPDNPHRDGIEVNPDNWQALVTEAMRAPDPAARLHTHLREWWENGQAATAGAPDTGQHTYDLLVLRDIVGSFNQSWESVLQDYAEDERKREDFYNELIERGLELTDPVGGAVDLTKETLGAIFGAIISGSVDPEEMPDLDYDFASRDNTWITNAVDEYNDENIPPYNDGDVTWDADPEFYEQMYGGDFTENGQVIDPRERENPDPRDIQAFNAWLQDPAVQLKLSERTW